MPNVSITREKLTEIISRAGFRDIQFHQEYQTNSAGTRTWA